MNQDHSRSWREDRGIFEHGTEAACLTSLGWRQCYLEGIEVEETCFPVRLVLEGDGGELLVAGGLGGFPGSFSSYSFPMPLARASGAHCKPSLGDWCLARPIEGRLELRVVLPRVNAPLGVANVDNVIIAVSTYYQEDKAWLERALRLAWEAGARPLLTLTKCNPDEGWEYAAEELGAQAFGVKVIPFCLKGGRGPAILESALKPASTSLVIGRKGAGTSNLIQALGASRVSQHIGRGLRATAKGAFLVEGGPLDAEATMDVA